MYQEVSQLLMYGDLDREGILYQLGELFGRYEKGVYDRMELVRDINTQVKHILKVATDYGFDDNLWHNYLTFFLMMSENPFSLTCEKPMKELSMSWLKMISVFSGLFLTMISIPLKGILGYSAFPDYPTIRQYIRRS